MTHEPRRRKANESLASGTPSAVEVAGPEPWATNSRVSPKTCSYHWRDRSRSLTVMPTWCMSPNVLMRSCLLRGCDRVEGRSDRADEDLQVLAERVDQRVKALGHDLAQLDLAGQDLFHGVPAGGGESDDARPVGQPVAPAAHEGKVLLRQGHGVQGGRLGVQSRLDDAAGASNR